MYSYIHGYMKVRAVNDQLYSSTYHRSFLILVDCSVLHYKLSSRLTKCATLGIYLRFASPAIFLVETFCMQQF